MADPFAQVRGKLGTNPSPANEPDMTDKLIGQAIRGPLDLAVVLPSLLGLGAYGLERAVKSVSDYDVNLGSQFFMSEAERVSDINTNLASDIASALTGTDFRVGPPENWQEMVVNLGTGALVGGGGSLGKLVSKAAPSSKAIRAAGAVLEAATPVTQNYSKGRVIANAVVPFAITEGLSESLEPETGDGYQSLIDTFQGQDDLPLRNFTPVTSGTTASDATSTSQQFQDAIGNVKTALSENEGLSTSAIVAGGALTALAALAVRRRLNTSRGLGSTIEGGLPNQERTVTPANKLGEQIVTENQDANFVLRNQFERAREAVRTGISPQTAQALDADDFAARLAQSTRIAGDHSTKAFLSTGLFPGTTKRTISLRDWQREYVGVQGNFGTSVTGLSSTAQAAFDKRAATVGSRRAALDFAIWGADSIDGRAIARAASGDTTARPSLSSFSDADIEHLRQVAGNDPQLQGLIGRYNQFMTDLIDYAADSGVLTRAHASTLRATRPNFMPNVLGQVEGTNVSEKMSQIAGALWKGVPEADTFQDLPDVFRSARSVETGGGLQNALDPGTAADIYTHSMMRLVLNNGIRRDFVNSLKMAKQADPNSALGKSFAEVDKAGPNTIRIFENGVGKFYEFDPLVAKSLEFAPFVAKNMVMNAARKSLQFTTTGPLAPLFGVAKTIWWDPLVASVQAPSGRSVSLLDSLSQQTLGVPLRLGAFDPTAVAGNVVGAGQDLVARAQLQLSSRIRADLANRSGLFSHFDDATMNHLANRMRQSYESSARGILDSRGTFNMGIVEDATTTGLERLRSAEAQIKAQLGTGGSAYVRVVGSMIEALHNGSRIRYFNSNYRPGMSDKELRQLVQETRELVGDFSKRGLGRVDGSELEASQSLSANVGRALYRGANQLDPTRNIVETVPYANTVIQALTRFGSALTDRRTLPVAVSAITLGAVVPTLGGLVASSNLGPEYLDYYWNKRPGWLRSTSAYFPLPGLPPEEGIEIPIAPEVAWISFPVVSAVATLTGLDSPRSITGGFNQDVVQGLSSLVGFMTPPVVQASANALGHKVELGLDPSTGSLAAIREIQAEKVTGAEVGSTPRSLVPANVEEMVRALTGTFGTMVLNTVTAGAVGEGDSIEDAGSQLVFEAGKRLGPATGPLGLMGGYTFTDVKSQQLTKVRRIDRILDIVNNSGIRHGIASEAIPLPLPGAPQLDPKFVASALPVYNWFTGNSAVAFMTQQRTALNKARVNHRAKFPHNKAWLQEDRKLAESIQGIDEQLLQEIQIFEQRTGIDLTDPVYDQPFVK